MFHYMLTPLEQHFDLGFGSVADSFKGASDAVLSAPQESRDMNDHLPASFLYRHSIELYFKSGIIIFHKKFKIPYGTVPYDGEPQVRIAQKWKPMYQVHALSELYPHWRQLFSDHAEYLKENTRTDWTFPPEFEAWISEIEAWDSTSTFFRYPVTKQREKDKDKSVIKSDHYLNIMSRMGPGEKPVKAFFVMNEKDEVTKAFYHEDQRVRATIETLKQASELLYGCHAAMRGELTDGW